MATKDKKAWAEKQVFTTGEAAEICNVSQQTIIRCFDSGRLNGFRVPGSRFRRIPRAELIKFMRTNEIPTDILETAIKRILLVDDDPGIIELLTDVFGDDDRFELSSAGNGYDAGVMTQQLRPQLVLLDYMLPDINGTKVCRSIKANPDLEHTKVLIVSGVVKQEDIDQLSEHGADGFVKKPFDIEKLLRQMEELLGL
ncbi:MAG: response regulator [Phycisphaerales bacterium]